MYVYGPYSGLKLQTMSYCRKRMPLPMNPKFKTQIEGLFSSNGFVVHLFDTQG